MARLSKKPRLAEVAKHANISVAAASRALADHPSISGETKRRVLAATELLGYRKTGVREQDAKAQAAAPRYGFVALGSPIASEAITGLLFHLSHIGEDAGMRLEYVATPRDMTGDDVFERVRRFSEGLDGLLLVGPVDALLSWRLQHARIVHVVLGHMLRDRDQFGPPPTTTVGFDDTAMGYWATSRLIQCGHKRVAFVCEELIPGLGHDRCHRGHDIALRDAGLPSAPELAQVTGEFGSGAGPAIARLLALAEPPTAYVAPDARIAASVIRELAARGVNLPRESIIYVGMENVVASLGLSDHPHLLGRVDVMAEQAVSQLHRLRLNPDAAPVEVLVPFEAFHLPGAPPTAPAVAKV